MVYTGEIRLQSAGECDILDITGEVSRAVEQSGVHSGLCCVFVTGSTGAITSIEYEPGVVQDLKSAIERMAPRDMTYQHDLAWRDGNGHSHVRAALMGPSYTVPILEGRMQLGTWQQIVFIDFDNRPRRRSLVVQIVGE